MHPRKITSARILLLLCLGLCLQHGFVIAQSPAQVLSLPEIVVTSFRGRLSTGKTLNGGTTIKHQPLPPGQPLSLPPGTRLDIFGDDGSTHALVAFPGIGGCMITQGSSLRIPETTETDMTVTFDRHISGFPNLMLLNINAAEMAKHGGAVFRTKNKFSGNSSGGSPHPKMVLTTQGGRFFILDGQFARPDLACTVGVLDGSASVEELTSKQQVSLKADQVVLVTPAGIGTPRTPTKAELSYDLGCKLAVLGREAPARLPDTMKTLAPTNRPGTRVNSLGMVFIPVPGTKVLMCVHETRWQDFAAYVASVPPLPDGKPHGRASGLWGWDDHPVTTSWDESQAFCAWLSQKEGKKYRLPTDEEWSRAAGIAGSEKRGPGTTPEDLAKTEVGTFPWGEVWPPPPNGGNIGDVSLHALKMTEVTDKYLVSYDDGFATTAPVMSFKPSKLGFYDLAGNVSEWCADWHNGSRTGRLIRGSNYQEVTRYKSHPSYRDSSTPDNAFVAGFRVVLEQP